MLQRCYPRDTASKLVSSPLRIAPVASGKPWLSTDVLTHATPSTSAGAMVQLDPLRNVGEQGVYVSCCQLKQFKLVLLGL